MAVRDRQILITNIMSIILGQQPEPGRKFEWLINKHTQEHFKHLYPVISKIFRSLDGNEINNTNKNTIKLNCDAYYGGEYNFIFEFDEHQHFSSFKLIALKIYPEHISYGFDLNEYIEYCDKYKSEADIYFKSKKTVDFSFSGGRTAQRAYLDSFRDLLPPFHGLNKTIRINEFEVSMVSENSKESRKVVENILKKRL